MPKRQSKLQKLRDQYTAYRAVLKGEKPKRPTHKDGGVPTHSTVRVPELSENDVLSECMTWLKREGFVADRMNVGAGDFGGGYRTYGIKGAGDILVIAPDGLHIEIECKAGKGGVWSESQQKRCKKIRGNKAVYMVIHGRDELKYRFREKGLM